MCGVAEIISILLHGLQIPSVVQHFLFVAAKKKGNAKNKKET
jgi:hypothetical protein